MQYYLVAPTIIAHGEYSLLTYHSEESLQVGSIVSIEVGKRSAIGIIYEHTKKPQFKTKPIIDIIESRSLPPHLIFLARWISEYYSTHLALVLQTILPTGLQKKRRITDKSLSHPIRNRTNIVLNKDQNDAISTIENAEPGTILLRGVTGSGKTQVYIEAAKKSVEQGKSVIVLVPEIALTSQLVAEFAHHFTNPIVTHSTMTEAQRHLIWRKCLESSEPLIVIGPRSALFSPLQNLGLIIVDECHDSSYNQDQAPRYSALRAASILARLAKAKVVFGSATPNIVDLHLARHADRPIAVMPVPAQKNASKPSIDVIDMTKKNNFTRHRFLSDRLLATIEHSLGNNTQSLLFHNRRGSAPTTLCEKCGWIANCPQCYLPMTLHGDSHSLKCHTCGYSSAVPPNCPQCQQPDIIHRGIGTKMITAELEKLFPRASIARFDADTASADQLQARYQELYDGKISLIVGTQMIAKGLDLPHLRMVGVIQADSGLAIPDYQSPERVFQLIYQVAGRVGRNENETNVVIQTFQPEHQSVKLGIARDYDTFAEYAIAERQRAFFPPFCHILKLTCSYATEASAIRASSNLAKKLRESFGTRIHVLGPAPSFYERLGGTYRWQLILKSTSRSELIHAAALVPKQHWTVDLDPANLL